MAVTDIRVAEHATNFHAITVNDVDVPNDRALQIAYQMIKAVSRQQDKLNELFKRSNEADDKLTAMGGSVSPVPGPQPEVDPAFTLVTDPATRAAKGRAKFKKSLESDSPAGVSPAK